MEEHVLENSFICVRIGFSKFNLDILPGGEITYGSNKWYEPFESQMCQTLFAVLLCYKNMENKLE